MCQSNERPLRSDVGAESDHHKEVALATMWTLTFLIILSLALGIAAWFFFLWSVKSGHYDDVERPKHRMLDDEEE